jgi:electron transfer flavoprotein alpha subunit
METLVFIEAKDKISKSALETVYYASEIGETTVITYGNLDNSTLNILGEYGASKVLIQKTENKLEDSQLIKLIISAANETNADVIIISQDQVGKAIAPRVAAKLEAGHVSGAVSLPDTSNGFVVESNVFSGKAKANISVNSSKKVISLLPNSFSPKKKDVSVTIKEVNLDLGETAIKVLEKKSQGEGVPLPEAELVVSAGRGLKGPENWGIVEDLAKVLGATTACSRPVADIGWRPHHEHVGQTGIAIRPNLYIAIGISGAIQHLAGVNGSKVIVVINTDAEAPFFKAADYGVVGDAFEVLPKLAEAVKKYIASNN